MCAISTTRKSVFLSTAVVRVKGGSHTVLAHVLLDKASETTLIRREFCIRNKLPFAKNENSLS